MRTINDNYIDLALSESRQPVVVVKILNSTQTIYFTTDTVAITDAGALFKYGSIKAGSFAGQKIKPEAAISSVGSMSLDVDDSGRELTDALTAIDQAGGSLFNDKVEIYSGFKELDFSDYIQITPLYVKSFKPTEISYQFEFTDIQRITKKSIFVDPKKTELVGNYSFSDAGTIEVISTTGFETVSHDADWYVDPSLTVGYIKVKGINSEGREAKEIISYTGKTATEFTGCQRARMGTERINLSAQDENSNPQELEITEVIYIDLPQPAMVLALLTGDLYGQVGQSLPDHWHAGLDASVINTPSFVNINGANWGERIEFRDTETQDAKDFIAEQCLAPYGTFLRVDQTGQYELAKFDYVNQQSSADLVLTYDQLINQGQSTRSAKDIKNNFLFNWGWRVDGEYYARRDFYPDTVSQQKHKFTSELVEIELLGLRNRDKNSKTTLDFVAQSMVKRLSNPAIRRNITVDMGFVIDREVGDLISLRADNEPDYRTGGVYQETFEIQGVSFDFLAHTATLQLFASEGTPTDFNVDTGNNTASIGRSGWADLATTGYGTESGGVFTFTNLASVADGKYYYDGDVEVDNSDLVFINGSVYIDCDNFNMQPDSRIDGIAAGKLEAGYFGLGNTAQSGIKEASSKDAYRNNQGVVADSLTSIKLDDVIRVKDGQQIDDLIPEKLFGTYGPAGGDSLGRIYDGGSFPFPEYTISGGAEVNGGAGLFISCNLLTHASSAKIDVSGAGNNIGSVGDSYYDGGDEGEWQNRFIAGSSGFGWNGVVIVALKDKSAARPLLSDLVVAKSGEFNYNTDGQEEKYVRFFNRGSNRNYITRFNPWTYSASVPESSTFANTDYAGNENQSAIKIVYLVTAGDTVSDPVLDPIEAAPTPIVTTVRNMNTPETAQGDQVTYELTATPNDATEYVQFEYSVSGSAYNPCLYVTSTESNLRLTATGEAVKIRATAFNKAGKAGGSSITNITLPLVERNTSTSAGGTETPDISITVPKIRGLELVNRIDSAENWDKFKSPNAEFRWKKLSITNSGSIVQLNGSADLHLAGYNVRISKLDGTILREEITTDAFYTYTFDKNKIDTLGSPVREFKVEVQAVATTGFASPFNGFNVENPEPSAPTGIQANAGFTGVEIKFDLPTDIDFVGCDFYLIEGTGDPFTATPERISGNAVTRENLSQGTEYRYGLRSVDQFGNGAQTTSLAFTTRQIEAADVDDLGPWATIEQADQAFIATYMESGSITEALLSSGSVTNTKLAALAVDAAKLANSAVTSDKITSSAVTETKIANAAITSAKIGTAAITEAKIANAAVGNAAIQNLAVNNAKIADVAASKITAGTISASNWIQVGTDSAGVRIDGASATVVSKNSGYTSFFGPLNVPAESSNPLVFGAYSGSNYAAWIDSAGHFKYGLGDSTISFNGSALEFGSDVTIGSNEDRTVTVGSGGDYATLDSALEALSRVVPAYKDSGFTATINCLSGYTDTGTHYLRGVNLSWVTITSATGTLNVSNSAALAWFRADSGAQLPFFDVNITVLSGGFTYLFYLRQGSRMQFNFTKTVTQTATPSDSQAYFLSIQGKSHADLTAITVDGFYNSIACTDGAHVTTPALIDNSHNAIYASNSSVDALSVDIDNCSGTAIGAEDTARINAEFVTLGGTKPEYGIYAQRGATVEASENDLSGCSLNGVVSLSGSNVNIKNGNARKGASDGSQDIVIGDGATISAIGATGGTNVTTNSITFRGIIYKV